MFLLLHTPWRVRFVAASEESLKGRSAQLPTTRSILPQLLSVEVVLTNFVLGMFRISYFRRGSWENEREKHEAVCHIPGNTEKIG